MSNSNLKSRISALNLMSYFICCDIESEKSGKNRANRTESMRSYNFPYFSIEYSRYAGERMATGIFIYTRPKDQLEKNHNKEAMILVATKKSELLLEQQAIGTGFIPGHKFKANFMDYYGEFVKNNIRKGNRHLSNSQSQFTLFLGKEFISPIDITEELCKRFRGFCGIVEISCKKQYLTVQYEV